MAGVKISQLQDGGALQPTDAFPVARGSFTRKILGSEIINKFIELDTKITQVSADAMIIDNFELSAMPAYSVKSNPTDTPAKPTDVQADQIDTVLLRPSTGNIQFGKVTPGMFTGVLPISSGGTGQTTAPAALNALAPAQTGNAGKFLQTDGSGNITWASAVTSAQATNLGQSVTLRDVTITSSTGTSTKILSASPTQAGVMTATDKSALTVLQSNSAINVVDSPTIDLNWNASTRTLSAGIQNGFIFVPVFDPVTTTNCGVGGINVISYSVTGPTNSTDFTGATQTATLSPPPNAYVALINVEIVCNTNDSSTTGDIYLYFRKNSSDPWRLGLSAETLAYTIEANETAVFPIIFDYTTKTFQAYLYHDKNSTASSPLYTFSVSVLGYFIK